MTLLAELLSIVFERRDRHPRPLAPDDRPTAALTRDLVGSAGDSSGLPLAVEILARFQAGDDAAKLDFFRHLSSAMNIDPEEVRNTLDAYERDPSGPRYDAFMTAAEPPRQELIRRLNRVPRATEALVRMRADLLRLGRDEPALQALDLDFRHLFSSWFNRGFLVLRPISWESPAHILEKIIAYEAVHAIDSWDDLRRRLQPGDRRCFAFFHPAMPDEPLIFVEVALTRGIARSIHALLAEDRKVIAADDADTAMFYSISNCQAGLAGISFGSSLIKQVAADLSAGLPGLSTFATLSPIPGLARWAEAEGLALEDNAPALAAHYLLHAKGHNGLPLDPVARFHLSNGAIVQAVHPQADLSEKGRAQSGGTMVTYLYDLPHVAQNQRAFETTRTIPATEAVKALAALRER